MNSVVPAAEHELLEAGTLVGDYEIEREIGHGGMGVVYGATHPVIGKQAAIKVLRREMAANPVAVERFIQEARAVNGIGHANIIDVFAFGNLPDGRPYLMMDLLVGESLRTRLKRGPLHVSEAASVLDEVASALAAAHAKGVIHRDLKPDNVFLVARQGRWPEVKLLDFGLAKLMPGGIGSGEAGGVIERPIRTHTGIVLGTPDYMAPEQVRERSTADPRCDVYALGVMAFESLTGRRPFPAAEGYEAMLAIVNTPAPELAPIAPHLPKDLAYLVDGMLLKDPRQRPTLAELRSAFKRLRAVLPTQSVASMEIQLPARPAVELSLGGLTASRVGASPLLPPASAVAEVSMSAAPVEPTTVPAQRPMTRPPVAPPGLGAPAGQAVPTPRAKALQTAALQAQASNTSLPIAAPLPPQIVQQHGPSVIGAPNPLAANAPKTMPGTMPPRRALSDDELSELPTSNSRALKVDGEDLEATVPRDKMMAPLVPREQRASQPAVVPPAYASPPPQASLPPQASGLAREASLMPTRLGVHAPPRVMSGAHPVLPPSVAPPRSRGGALWLVLGALLAIGAGVALAVALTS
jgi:serine/threonine-protein kinase